MYVKAGLFVRQRISDLEDGNKDEQDPTKIKCKKKNYQGCKEKESEVDLLTLKVKTHTFVKDDGNVFVLGAEGGPGYQSTMRRSGQTPGI